MFLLLKTRGELRKLIETYIACAKMFLNLFWKFVLLPGNQFCFRNNVPRGGQTGKHLYIRCFRNNISIETINIS